MWPGASRIHENASIIFQVVSRGYENGAQIVQWAATLGNGFRYFHAWAEELKKWFLKVLEGVQSGPKDEVSKTQLQRKTRSTERVPEKRVHRQERQGELQRRKKMERLTKRVRE